MLLGLSSDLLNELMVVQSVQLANCNIQNPSTTSRLPLRNSQGNLDTSTLFLQRQQNVQSEMKGTSCGSGLNLHFPPTVIGGSGVLWVPCGKQFPEVPLGG